MSAGKRIKVLIVDDSAMVRKLLTELLSRDRGIEVIGTAMDAYMAREKIKRLNPDVLTLDVEMPRMDGLTFLRNLMKLRPMPVVMVSTLTEKGAAVTLDALAYGAVDFIAKPKIDLVHGMTQYAEELIDKIKAAAGARVRQYRPADEAGERELQPCYSVEQVLEGGPVVRHFRTTEKLIAIGASTGGTEAIREILESLPPTMPGIVVVQHIPAKFSRPFAERINARSALSVCEAGDGDLIVPGHVYIAPGGLHLSVRRDGSKWRCRVHEDVPVNRHRPSVDVLFRSVANAAGPNAIGLILTGMGKDGARGLRDMRECGASTLAQDEASSVVWGMPGSAVAAGAVQEVLPLSALSRRLLELSQSQRAGAAAERAAAG